MSHQHFAVTDASGVIVALADTEAEALALRDSTSGAVDVARRFCAVCFEGTGSGV